MSEVVFARIDFRLIHGQVITKWIRLCDASEIVIVDDALESDSFMASIYTMAAPPGYKVSVYSVDHAIEKWRDGTFADGKVFLMTRDIATFNRVVKGGLPVGQVQVGGIEFKPGRTKVYGTMSLDDADAKLLKEVADEGVEVYVQSVPEDSRESLASILKKHSFNL